MGPDVRLRRRELAARRRRRRRLGALAVVVIAASFAVGGAALAGAFGSSGATEPRAVTARKAAPRLGVARRSLLRPAATPSNRAVPILMYHVLDTAPAGAAYPELYVRPADFRGQMAWLAKQGFRAVTLRQVYDAWKRGAALPRRPVVVSFDDGYRSVHTVGLPVLRSHGWVGVLNLAVEHQWTDLPPRLVWELRSAGWELDDHTFTHPELTGLDDASLEREVAGSRAFLRKQYRVPVEFFCYPAGRYDDRVIAAVRKAGYLGATTTDYGLARPGDGLFTLKRVRVQASDGVAGFAARMRALHA